MIEKDDGPISRSITVGHPRARTRARVAATLALAAIVVLVSVTSFFAFRSERAGERSFWLLASAPVVGVVPVALVFAAKKKVLGEWMRPKAGDFTVGFLGAAILFAGAYAFSKVVTPNGSPRAIWLARLYLQLGDPNVLRAHPTFLLTGLIAVSAAEEIVWRGLVPSLIEEALAGRRRNGAVSAFTDRRRADEDAPALRWGWLASAGLYALAYVPAMWSLAVPNGPNPVLPLAALGAGVAWGWMAWRFNRLAPGIVSHVLFDWCVVVIFRLWGESL
jgi:membrane protease YdiL (CAAX protease family)